MSDKKKPRAKRISKKKKKKIVRLKYQHNYFICNFFLIYKNDLKGLSFEKRDITKNAIHNDTTLINIDKVDINKIVLSDKVSWSNNDLIKYYIGYIHRGGVIPLSIQLPQLTGYSKHFNADNKYIDFLVTEKKLLKKYNEVLDKIKGLFKKKFDKKPLYNNRYISAKIDDYNGTEFKYKVLKDNKHCKYMPIEPKKWQSLRIFIHDIIRSILVQSNKYYPQKFLKKSKYEKDKEAALSANFWLFFYLFWLFNKMQIFL